CKAHALKVLCHLYRSPSVKCDFEDVVLLAQLLDELLDETIVDDVSLGRHEVSLLVPDIVRNGRPAHTQRDGVLRYPEEREHDVFLILCPGREHQYKSCD